MRNLIREKLAAIRKQRNVKNWVKKGHPMLEEYVDNMTGVNKMTAELRKEERIYPG